MFVLRLCACKAVTEVNYARKIFMKALYLLLVWALSLWISKVLIVVNRAHKIIMKALSLCFSMFLVYTNGIAKLLQL